jgi:glycosyltransferase involved in cell wall biosynthesis
MSKRKLLYICHNHPSVRPGGAEAYALELYHAMRDSEEFEPIFLAKGGGTYSASYKPHAGTMLGTVNDDPNQYFMFTDGYTFDWVNVTAPDKELYTKHFHEFLAAFRPDLVHFQHTIHLGFDLLRQVRNTLPEAPIAYTLHEYIPICHNQGQLVRTETNERCSEATPRRCHECFPHLTPATFFLRKRFIQSHLSLVDAFLAPSRFLMERYIDWGIPPAKIRFEEYGRLGFDVPPEVAQDRPRNRIGYFGQLHPYKGLDVALKAMKILEDEKAAAASPLARRGFAPGPSRNGDKGEPHLWVHGANLDMQREKFQKEVKDLLAATQQSVTFVGRYHHTEISKLMSQIDWVLVPSIWWENSPLVIQEAFIHGRPVICSDIGGMAEKVSHGVNGLHFRAGDPISLAETLRQAVSTPGLWDKLRSGVPQVYPMKDHVAAMTQLYRNLLDRRTPWPQ